MGRLTRDGYEQLIREDIEWLLRQPRTLERDHIEAVLRDSPARLYGESPPHPGRPDPVLPPDPPPSPPLRDVRHR